MMAGFNRAWVLITVLNSVDLVTKQANPLFYTAPADVIKQFNNCLKSWSHFILMVPFRSTDA